MDKQPSVKVAMPQSAGSTIDHKSPLNKRISAAWQTLVGGQAGAAIKEFEQILAEDQDNLDALYGLGLAQKINGDASAARPRWERALELARSRVDALGTEHSLERERIFMSSTMLQQRLKEING